MYILDDHQYKLLVQAKLAPVQPLLKYPSTHSYNLIMEILVHSYTCISGTALASLQTEQPAEGSAVVHEASPAKVHSPGTTLLTSPV